MRLNHVLAVGNEHVGVLATRSHTCANAPLSVAAFLDRGHSAGSILPVTDGLVHCFADPFVAVDALANASSSS